MFFKHFLVPIPTFKPLGMVTISIYIYFFILYVKGNTLDKIWLRLNKEQKGFI